MIKNGLLSYPFKGRKCQNIGDYIQSLAANQFMNTKLYVSREALDEYSGEPIKLILNGWFMHNPEHFPPSEKISPLFLSFHIAPSIKDKLLSEEVIGYLKKHGPIGCRDENTKHILQEKGIPAYYSGCLTMTLGETKQSSKRKDSIYIVDPYPYATLHSIQTISYALVLMPFFCMNFSKIKKIYLKIRYTKNRYDKYPLLEYIYALLLYKTYSQIIDDEILLNAEYITHSMQVNDELSEQAKFEYADKLLEKYASASLVITSRIHCALPCLGLNTPFLFVENSHINKGRYAGLVNLFNVIECNSPFNICIRDRIVPQGEKITKSTNVVNKENHLDVQKRLIKTCNEFVFNYNNFK